MNPNHLIVAGVALLAYYVWSTPEGYANDEEWSENDNGNPNFQKYPPCYDICGATRKIYDILEGRKRLAAHKRLLDLYSMVLCQEKHLLRVNNDCSKTMIHERIKSLKDLGARFTDVAAFEKVMKILGNKVQRTSARDFLVGATHVLERHLASLMRDPKLTADDKAKIKSFHEVFYDVHYDKIACAK